MQTGPEKNSHVRELERRFALVEERFHVLVDQNKDLKARIAVLEAELDRMRGASRELEELSGTRLQLRERIENVLKSLDAVTLNK